MLVEPEKGTQLDVPTHIFSAPDGSSHRGTGLQLKRQDGRAVLAFYSLNNTATRDTPATYVRKNFKVPEATIDYRRVTKTNFAISAVNQGEIYYSRCNFSHASGGALHCFDLKYPLQEKRAWDPIVTRISLSLRPLERPR